MKLDKKVELIYFWVIIKFGYDQINISYRNVLLKNISNPVVNMPNTLNVSELCSTSDCVNTGRSNQAEPDRCIVPILVTKG